MNTTTIAAIATPIGSGGIGIIRISGPLSIQIASQIFSSASLSSNKQKKSIPAQEIDFVPFRLHYGFIIDPKNNLKVDEVLIAFMKAPRSYTCEDVIEIHSHSNAWVMKHILELTLEYGAQLAEPGEFTKRAFLNGRIDLTQAEAVSDIISAKSETALNAALTQLDGKLKNNILILINEIDLAHSALEATIDFYDETEEEDFHEHHTLIDQLKRKVLEPINQFIQTHECAVFLKDGLKLSIVGQPNVGKSSLMNQLIEKNRSIVTDLPGTTRDIVEDQIMIRGIPITISDTAGLHETDHPIEKIGIQKAEDQLINSDLVLFLVDIQCPAHPENLRILRKIQPKKVILVMNKMDLLSDKTQELSIPEFSGLPCVHTSAKLNRGIDELKDLIETSMIQSCPITPGQTILPNLRHHQVFSTVRDLILQAITAIQSGLGNEVAAIDLEEAERQLKSIIGQFDRPDVLNTIFSQFCIGK